MLDNGTFLSVQYASQSNSEHLFDVAVFVDVLQKCKWIGFPLAVTRKIDWCWQRKPQKEGKMKQYKRGIQYANIGIADVTVGHNDGFVEQSTQNSAANAAQATNDPIVQNAFVGHNDQSMPNAPQPLAQTDEQNGIAVQALPGLFGANYPISCTASLYGVRKSDHATNQILTASSTNYLMCKIDVTPRSVYKTITRAYVRIKQKSCNGTQFCVMPAASNNIMLMEADPTNNLDTLTQGDITYKVFDIGHFLQDNKAQTLFFAIAGLDGSSFTATSATAISVQVQYAEEDDLAVNGAELNYSVGAKGSYSVNVRNGKLLYSHALHSAPGNLLPLSLSLNYNVGDIALANKGWSFGYEQSLRQSGANYIYRDGAGRNHRFVQSHNVGTVYNDVTSRTGLILYPVDDEWEISDGKTTTLRFNNSKRLRLITVAKGSTPQTTAITYNANGQIASVVDGLGTTYDFDRTVNGQVTVKRGTTALVTVTYDSDGNPTKIANCLDSADYTDFTYDSATKLLATVTDNASRNKAVLGYNNIGNVLSACNYVVSGGKANATECYHLCYKYLHTYVKFCRNTDLESKAYKTYDYQFAEDGELLSAAEDRGGNNLSGVRFRTKDDYSRYSSAVASAPLAVFKTESDTVLSVTKDTTSGTSSATSATQTVDTTDNTNEQYVFSAMLNISDGSSANSATQKIRAQLFDGNTAVAELQFDPTQRAKQVQATNVRLSKGSHDLSVRLEVKGIAAKVTLNDVRLTASNNAVETEVTNLNTSLQNFSEHSSAGVKVWYKAAPVNLIAEHSKIELLSEVKFTVKDFNLTKLSYIKNPQKFNVWYNDGADLLYGVSALSVRSSDLSGTSLTISSLNYGTVTESIGTKTFTYMLPTDTVGEYKVVTAIDDGTTAKTTEQMFNTYCLPTSTTDYNGVTQSTTYDQYGNVVTEKTSATPSATMNITKDYGYSAGGKLLTSEKTYRGTTTYTTSHAYDEHNYPTSDTAPNGQVTNYGLNASKEKMVSVSTPLDSENLANNFDYDGDLVKTLAHNGTTFAFAYDGRNNIASVNIGNGVFTQNKDITYNENGTCVSKTTYGNGQIITKYYNKYNKLVKVTSTSGSTATTLLAYLYSDEDVAATVTDPFDSSLKVSESSPLRVEINDGVRTTYTYDNCGQLVKTANNIVTIEKPKFDDYGRVKIYTASVNGVAVENTSYIYRNNVDANLQQELSYSYNSAEYSSVYERDALQRPKATKVTLENIGYETYYYYAPRQKKIQSSSSGGFGQVGFGDEEIVNIGTTSLVSEIAYYKLATNGTRTLDSIDRVIYDANGNITQYGNVYYHYDKLDRLIREDNPSLDKTIVWEYNNTRNPVKRIEYAYTVGTPSNATKTTVLTYNSSWKDQLTAVDGQTIVYDKAGNPTKYGDMTMSWTRGRLLDTCKIDKTDVKFTYYGDGFRKSKTPVHLLGACIDHFYYYAGGHLISEHCKGWNNTQVEFEIQYNYNQQGIIGFCYNRVDYTYRKNFFGDITAIYDVNGNCVAKYAYDATGVCKVLNPNGAENKDKDFIGNLNPIRYRGYYYDVETGFYYCGSRYFVPQLGLWLNHDDMLDKQDSILTTSSATTTKAMAVISTATKNEEKPADSKPKTGWDAWIKPSGRGCKFYAGYDNDASENPISWLNFKMFCVEGSVLNDSFLDVKLSTVAVTFRTPSNDNGVGAYFNLECPAAELNVGILGGSAKAKWISASVGVEVQNVSFEIEVYGGCGVSVDFSEGIKLSLGAGLGIEISIKFSWTEIFSGRWLK